MMLDYPGGPQVITGSSSERSRRVRVKENLGGMGRGHCSGRGSEAGRELSFGAGGEGDIGRILGWPEYGNVTRVGLQKVGSRSPVVQVMRSKVRILAFIPRDGKPQRRRESP